jgi:putative Mg2+ transporter-C (MgtC) family protein
VNAMTGYVVGFLPHPAPNARCDLLLPQAGRCTSWSGASARFAAVVALQLDVLANVATGFGLTYALGFERQLRGSVAGDRTFALVGTSAAAITALTHTTSPQAIAGIVTGIGFIGGGVVFKLRTGSVHGVTTAATILGAAAIGIVAGYGDLLLAVIVAAVLLLLLEIPQIPLLKFLDARTYMGHARPDPDLTAPDPSSEADMAGPTSYRGEATAPK